MKARRGRVRNAKVRRRTILSFGELSRNRTGSPMDFTRSALGLRCVFARFHDAFDGTRIASLIPCKNFLSAGAIVASAPRNFTRSSSTKEYGQRRTRPFSVFNSPEL